MDTEPRVFSRKSAPQRSARMVEIIFRCKWSLTVFQLLKHDIRRPGEMVRSVEGLTKKVLHDCLNKLVEFKIVERRSHNEIPPRVEYFLTRFGEKFTRILDELESLQSEIDEPDEPERA